MLTVTDLFAGAGGSSTGMVSVPGVEVRIAANHWDIACQIHNANHPDTDHSTADLHEENPAYFPRTDVLWASPECTKWSQANGTKLPDIEEGLFEDPLSDDAKTRSRLLMFDVLRFIEHHRYRLVFIENVVDIATQAKYRLAWSEWRTRLAALGYAFRVISLNSMHAQAFGAPAPQSRDRIYIAAWPKGETPPDFDRILRPRAYCPRCDEVVEAQQAFKPGRTVGRYRQAYIYLHGSCGTTVEPGWLPAAAAIDWSITGERIGDRLKPKTRARIAAGIARYWGAPFHFEHGGNQYDAADPKHPQHGDPNAYYRAWSVTEYLRTLHTAETKALAIPVEARDGKTAQTVGQPFRTQTTRLETALVQHRGLVTPAGGTWNEDARSTDDYLRTITTRDTSALVTPYYGSAEEARPTDRPIGTLTTVDRYALVHRNNDGGAEMTTPAHEYLRTLTTTGHQSLIQASTPTGRPRVTPADVRAAEELVPECLFRMLRPHEVAAGMAFPADYNWQPPDREKPVSNRDLVKAAGNAVTPPAARDLMHVGAEWLA
ncbi:DNA cytosine methyltransferase [Nocardioides sp.]|uniref:DNA cytosine methyltransferase n=1 Tax=Nocardioides sp. TaxID=35761 RepID=UPI0035152EB9